MTFSRKLREDPTAFKGVSFGYPLLDKYTGGANRDEIIVITADTGVGKTTLVRSMAYNLLMAGERVAWISLEMPPHKVLEAFVEAHLKRPYAVNGVLQATESEIAEAEQLLLKNRGLTLYRGVRLDTSAFCEAIEHAYLAHGCRVIVIDHLAILTADKSWQEIDRLMSEINEVVLRHHLCVIAVAQNSHTGNIRGSKGIDQIASVVLEISRSFTSNELIVATRKTYRYSPVGYGKFKLVYRIDEKFFEEEEIYTEDEEEGTKKFKSFFSKNRKTTQVEEPIRKIDSSELVTPCSSVRADFAEMGGDSQLPPRLQLHVKERQAYICGSEGLLTAVRPCEVNPSARTESTGRLADFI